MWERRWRERFNTKARYTVAVITIVTEPNAPLTYAPGSEHHHLIMSKLGGHGGRLERDRDTMDGVRSCDIIN